MPRLIELMLSVLGLFLSVPALGAVTVGAGSIVNFGDALVGFDCQDMVVAGQVGGTSEILNSIAGLSIVAGGSLAPGAGIVSLGGDFANAGSFVPGSSRVAIVDSCGNGSSRVSGTTSFYDFFVTTTNAKQLVLPAGATQTVVHGLTLRGATGNLLGIASSSAGIHAFLAIGTGAAQTVSFVDARDNTASAATIAPGTPAQYSSIDGGGLVNWFGGTANGGGGAPTVQAPLLDALGGAVLLLGLLLIAARQRASTQIRVGYPHVRVA